MPRRSGPTVANGSRDVAVRGRSRIPSGPSPPRAPSPPRPGGRPAPPRPTGPRVVGFCLHGPSPDPIAGEPEPRRPGSRETRTSRNPDPGKPDPERPGPRETLIPENLIPKRGPPIPVRASIPALSAPAAFISALLAALLMGAVPRAAQAQDPEHPPGGPADEPGWSGVVDASSTATGGNTEVLSLAGSGQVQYRVAPGALPLHRQRRPQDIPRRGHRGAERGSPAPQPPGEFLVELGGLRPAPTKPVPAARYRFLFGLGARSDGPRNVLAAARRHPHARARQDQISPGPTSDSRISTFAVIDGRLNDLVTLQLTVSAQPRSPTSAICGHDHRWGPGEARRGAPAHRGLGGWRFDTRPPARVKKTDWEVTTGLGILL